MAETPAPKPDSEKLSHAPSWILIGFVVGCLVAHSAIRYYDAHWASKPAPVIEPVKPPTAAEKAERAKKNRPDLWLVEALFEQRAPEVVWQDNLTEIVLWNEATNDFKDGVEVLRRGDKFYYRSIDQLTRHVIEGSDMFNGERGAIVFTETETARLLRQGKATVEVIKIPDLKPPGHEKHAELPRAQVPVTPVPQLPLPDVPTPTTDPKLP